MTSKINLYYSLYQDIEIYISNDEKEWKKIESNTDLQQTQFNSFIVLNPDGQIMDGENEFEPLPKGAYYIEDRKLIDQTPLPYLKEINFEPEFLKIENLVSPFHKFDNSLYSTRITNTGTIDFKINRFSAFSKNFLNKIRKRPLHSTIVDGWFNNNDFIHWYGLRSEWIKPGDSVSDHRNYGNRCIWVYEVKTQDGRIYWIGANKKKLIKP